jgi:hypothetical protein
MAKKTKAPELSAADVATLENVTKPQILKLLRQERIPGAYRGVAGIWHIPANYKITAAKRGNPTFQKKTKD